MGTLLNFVFKDTDGMGTDVSVLVVFNTPLMANEIESIKSRTSSWAAENTDWQYEELVEGVLSDFGYDKSLDYTIVDPVEIDI